jgi:hypothetical protein
MEKDCKGVYGASASVSRRYDFFSTHFSPLHSNVCSVPFNDLSECTPDIMENAYFSNAVSISKVNWRAKLMIQGKILAQ